MSVVSLDSATGWFAILAGSVTLSYLLYTGKRHGFRQQKGWWYIVVALVFISLAGFLDTTDEFPGLSRFVIIGDTKYQAVLATIGYIGGALLFLVGFFHWLPAIGAVKRAEEALRSTQDELQTRVDERTAELSATNDALREEITERKLAAAELRLRSQELEALFKIGGLLAGPGSFEEKAVLVVDELGRIIGADSVTLRLPNEEAGGLRLVARAGDQVFSDRPLTQGAPKGLSVAAFEAGVPVVANDYPSHPYAEASAVAQGSKSMASLPVKVGQHTLGVITAVSKEPNHFNSERVALLTAIGDGLGPLLENARLAQELQSSREEMAAVDQVAKIITSTLDMDDVYARFASEVNTLIDFRQAAIGIIDESKGTMNVAYLAGQVGSFFQQGQTYSLEGTFAGRIAQTREPLIVGDLKEESRYWTAEQNLKDGLRSVVAVPLISKDKLIGTLILWSENPGAYGNREQVILERLAAQIAPAIDNSRLFQEVQQLALALESIGDAVAFLDLEGNFQYVNRAFQQVYGYSPDEVLGKSVSIIVPVNDHSQPLLGEALSDGIRAGWWGEVNRVRKDGEEIDVLLTITLVKNKDGRVIGRIGVSRDISVSKRAEARLQETARLSSIGELAAGVAHEINNPLTSVLGFSQLLLSEDLPQAVRDDLEIIYSEASRAAKIIHNLLSFARRPEPMKMYMDVTSVLERALGMKSYDFQVGNIRVTRDFSTDLPYTMADEQQLIQVFLNILSNAEQAMRRSRGTGRITVQTSTSDKGIKISISDDGPGIPEEHLNKVFEPFFTTKTVGEGTGLGLSISYGIVAQHEGDIWVESRPGHGTTFHIELPITGREANEFIQPAVTQVPLPGTKRVLVVDDEPKIREFLSRSLELDGLNVDVAGDGDEAWRSLQNRSYDCIILDLRMPGMSGEKLYNAIGAMGNELTKKVIFITGDMISSETLDFIAKAGNPALTKPVDLDQLRQWVRGSLEPAGSST